MSSNDIIVLNSILDQTRDKYGDNLENFEFFELFAFEQVLKKYDLSYNELDFGRTSGSDDGGIDGIFFFINSDFIEEEIDPYNYKRYPILELFIFQVTQTGSFAERRIDRLNTTTQDIFDLTKDMDTLRQIYNPDIIDSIDNFRNAYIGLASKHPNLNINYIYSSKGDTNQINQQITNRVNMLKELVAGYFSDVTVEVNLIGAKELLDLSRIEKTYTLTIKAIENPLSTGPNNFVILSSLLDYYDFITDENDNLRKYIFNANVRDFQGKVEVNNDIDKTLKDENQIDFWWLNNGITILATNPSTISKIITLDNIQIINGLQTTTCIYNYIEEKKKSGENDWERENKMSILIKILISDDDDVSDKIIKATNFQTSILPAQLKATDRIHHNIEAYFAQHDLYYDRRKNYYKNLGKPSSKVINIPQLSQSVMSMVYMDPSTARAHPASLIKSDQVYEKLFNETIDPSLYLFCAKAIKTVETVLKSGIHDFTSHEKSNLKLHISMVSIIKCLNNRNYTVNDIREIEIEQISEELIRDAAKVTIEMARRYIQEENTSLERLAKSKPFVEYLITNIDLSE